MMRTVIKKDDVIKSIRHHELGQDDILSFIDEYSTDILYDREQVIEFRDEILNILNKRLEYFDWIDDIKEAAKHNKV